MTDCAEDQHELRAALRALLVIRPQRRAQLPYSKRGFNLRIRNVRFGNFTNLPCLERCNARANFSIAASRAELSAPFPDGGDVMCARSNDQRPANSMLARVVLRRRFPMFRPNVGRLCDGTRSARNPSKLSEVTRPSAASCDKASST